MKRRTKLRRSLDRLILPSNFLVFLIVLLVILSALYIGTHLLDRGGSINNRPTVGDMSMLNEMDSNVVIFERQALVYLNEKYSVFQMPGYTEELRQMIRQLGKTKFITLITQTGIRKKSFFWLNGDVSSIEVIFWSLFGALCSFLYYFVENKKKGKLKQSEFPSYVAKLFYTPFISVIIYFSPNLFTKEENFSIFFGYWTIVVAFILGFFSGRAIELLDRLKNFIFPYTAATTTTEAAPTVATATEVPEDILVEAVREKSAEWNERYGPFESISVGKKRKGEEQVDVFCIQFDVKEKIEPEEEDRLIPPYIEYKASNNVTYQLPTDVNEVGETIVNLCYEPRDGVLTGANLSTKLLGLSCSRANQHRGTGTIGLKVKSRDPLDTKVYLLSCYHVLCPDELRQGNFLFENNLDTNGFNVFSPSLEDGGNTVIATVRKGILGNGLDIALAELPDPDILENRIHGTLFRPKKMLIVLNSHARVNYEVRLVGRTSGFQRGFVDSAFADSFFAYPTNADPNNKIEFKAIIKTCKISVPGDSGAAVYDKNGDIIGILFASNSMFSYVMPIQKVFSKLNLKFA